MANALACDRCGEVFASEDRFKLMGDRGMFDRDGEKLDLCRKCTKELEDFYDYKFDFVKEYKKPKK